MFITRNILASKYLKNVPTNRHVQTVLPKYAGYERRWKNMTSPPKKISYSGCRGYRPTPLERVTILSYALHACWEPAWGYICVSSFWVKPEVKAPSIEYECVTPHFLLSIIGRGWASKSAIALNISQLCLSPVVNLFLDWNPVRFHWNVLFSKLRGVITSLSGDTATTGLIDV